MNFKKLAEVILILVCLSLTFFFLYLGISKFMPGPCSKPVEYSIGEIDGQFGISKDELISDLKQAEAMWESASGLDLFNYSDSGEMKVNLIYDYRQKATDKINDLNGDIKSDTASYRTIKSEYDQLNAEYQSDSQRIESLTASYNQALSQYSARVSRWNEGEQSSQDEYDAILAEKQELDGNLAEINNLKKGAGAKASQLNSLAIQLNSVSRNIDSSVDDYNDTNSSLATEFEEGNFISENGQKQITVYQFENDGQLVRVLAHEMGHSLGLGHTNDPDDVMYGLNIGDGVAVTAGDLAELSAVCSKTSYDIFIKNLKNIFGYGVE